MTFGTTIYAPATEAGHRYAKPVRGTAWEPCRKCGGSSWQDIHTLTETHRDLTADEPPTFCVEASDDNGRSYTTNGLRWPAREDAERWAAGLSFRWFGCTDIRVRRCRPDGTPYGRTVHQTLSHA